MRIINWDILYNVLKYKIDHTCSKMDKWAEIFIRKNMRKKKQEALLMQTEPCEHTVSWNKHNSRNRLWPDVVDSSTPISLRQHKRVVGVGHRGQTQCCGGTASEPQSCSLVEIAWFEPTPPPLSRWQTNDKISRFYRSSVIGLRRPPILGDLVGISRRFLA